MPSFSELIDRLAIDQLKEVLIPEHKEVYSKELQDIMDDIGIDIVDKNIKLTPRLLRAIVIVAQINAHIWYNEASARKGEDQDLHKLKLTHGLNGIRQHYKNVILDEIKELKGLDYKVDCIAAEFKNWDISLK